MSEPLLQVRGLSISSGAGVIVSGLDLELAPGETIGLVGESGSGKSMTARSLVGLLPPGVSSTGDVELGGVNVLDGDERAWRRLRGREIALMLQDPYTMLSPLMRVGKQITQTVRLADGSAPRGAERRAEAARRLAEVGIRDERVIDRYPFQLSGGMRQRVGLAAALASDPKVLIADEPSTALDVTTQREILRLIRSTQTERGMGVLLITHDLRVAFSMCDRIYVLYAGAVVEVADATAMEQAPKHPYTRGLLLSEPPFEGRVQRLTSIPGVVPPAAEVTDRCAFASRCTWVEDRCLAGRPTLVEAAPRHLSACVRLAEIGPGLTVTAPLFEPAPAYTSSSSVLRVTGLVKRFDTGAALTVALDGVSLEVGPGESVGLVGESGSGKTTLSRCVIGLETPSAGSIEIDGVDATDRAALTSEQRTKLRETVQMVFQDPYSTLNPSRTIGFTLKEALRRLPKPPTSYSAEITELLKTVGLPAEYASRKPAALSGGERQRVAIARALALRPKILLCDEPVSALDVSVQAQVLNLFADLRERLGIGYLFITHDLAVVRQVADRLYVLQNGVIVEQGPTEQVLGQPAHDYTRDLIDSVPRSDPLWLQPAAATIGHI